MEAPTVIAAIDPSKGSSTEAMALLLLKISLQVKILPFDSHSAKFGSGDYSTNDKTSILGYKKHERT
jgi:hypothetical protein